MSIQQEDMVIIGGGPAGMAAAVSAKEAGCDKLLIVERDKDMGGILNQCIHNGFGLHTFQEELTGPEYAYRYRKMVEEHDIPYMQNTIVIDIQQEENGTYKVITAMNRERGLFRIRTKSITLAMGCRERPRGALNIPGYRPAGIYSAGTAQRYVNMEGRMPGKEAVILGSGDIGLIMARRMTLEGAKVKAVAEIMPYSGGLKRNIVQCLDDFDIPLRLSTTVVDIHGKERVEGVTLSQVDESLKPIVGTEEYIPCDTLLLSCGLIPENELSNRLGLQMDPVTNGPVVNERFESSLPGIFVCGNVLHVHDLVDYVSQEAAMAGKYAAAYVAESEKGLDYNPDKKISQAGMITMEPQNGIRYTVPSIIRPSYMEEKLVVRFRVNNIFQNVYLAVYFGKECIIRQKKRMMVPGEMEQFVLNKSDIINIHSPDLNRIIICLEPDN